MPHVVDGMADSVNQICISLLAMVELHILYGYQLDCRMVGLNSREI
jgi:hypothetical protein